MAWRRSWQPGRHGRVGDAQLQGGQLGVVDVGEPGVGVGQLLGELIGLAEVDHARGQHPQLDRAVGAGDHREHPRAQPRRQAGDDLERRLDAGTEVGAGLDRCDVLDGDQAGPAGRQHGQGVARGVGDHPLRVCGGDRGHRHPLGDLEAHHAAPPVEVDPGVVDPGDAAELGPDRVGIDVDQVLADPEAADLEQLVGAHVGRAGDDDLVDVEGGAVGDAERQGQHRQHRADRDEPPTATALAGHG